MNAPWVRHLPFIVIAASLAACPSPPHSSNPMAAEGSGVVIHSPSGMRFPEQVDEFRRVSLIRYDKEGLDVSAGYNSTNPSTPIVATVYIYPAPSLASIMSPAEMASARARLCADEFGRRKAEVVGVHPDARLIDERDVSLRRDNRQVAGKKASYELSGVFRGVRSRLSSELYVFCYIGEKWAVEYRFTWPRDAAAPEVIASFMDDLPWTISGVSPPEGFDPEKWSKDRSDCINAARLGALMKAAKESQGDRASSGIVINLADLPPDNRSSDPFQHAIFDECMMNQGYPSGTQ